MTDTSCTCTDDCSLGFNPACSCECGECDCRNIAGMIGKKRAGVFQRFCDYVADSYGINGVWKRLNVKTRKWRYEYKFSKSGKTLCGFYIADKCLGFMVILGKNERLKVEEAVAEYSDAFLAAYDDATTYHDGKWLMLELEDASLFGDVKKVLAVKRKPVASR